MPALLHTYTPEEDLFWVDVLRAIEAGEYTREEVMILKGISERTLKRRLARARMVWEDFRDDLLAGEDDSDLPHLAITDDPQRERGDWYELESGASSVDSGRVRVGNHNGTRLLVRSVNGGKPIEVTKKKEPPKFRPKRKKAKKQPVPAA